MPTVKDLKEHIKNLPNNEPVHYVLWFKEDLEFDDPGEDPVKPTREQAHSILDSLQENHDCNYGTTWDHVISAVNYELGELK